MNKNASFLCDGDVNYVLVSSSQADLTFSALHDKRSSGFKASYEILQSNFTGINYNSLSLSSLHNCRFMSQARLTWNFEGIARRSRIAKREEQCRLFVKQWLRQIFGQLLNVLGSGLRLNAYCIGGNVNIT